MRGKWVVLVVLLILSSVVLTVIYGLLNKLEGGKYRKVYILSVSFFSIYGV